MADMTVTKSRADEGVVVIKPKMRCSTAEGSGIHGVQPEARSSANSWSWAESTESVWGGSSPGKTGCAESPTALRNKFLYLIRWRTGSQWSWMRAGVCGQWTWWRWFSELMRTTWLFLPLRLSQVMIACRQEVRNGQEVKVWGVENTVVCHLHKI